jgi:hypothetical protein
VSISLAARIQHHPSRARLIPPLLEALAPLPTEVIAHVSDPPSPWDGYKLCLSDLPDCSHLLVIQDDAIPCRNFVPALKQIAVTNDVPVCLFLARLPRRTSTDATKALKANRRYVTLFIRDFVPVVAVLWPRAKAQEFMVWAQNAKLPGQPNPRSDDAVVGRWMMTTRQEIRTTCPSLVEHPDMEASLIGRQPSWGKDPGRVALHLAEDALAYDW